MQSIKCPMCGKTFKPGDNPNCGGTYNGEPICNEKPLKRELEARLAKTEEKG